MNTHFGTINEYCYNSFGKQFGKLKLTNLKRNYTNTCKKYEMKPKHDHTCVCDVLKNERGMV